MAWLQKLFFRLRTLFRTERVEQELDEELRFHLEKQIAENVAAGMDREEADYAARRRFGGVEQIKEACRDMRGVNFIETLIQDLRYGWRMLRRNPVFTAVAILSLSLGIGANTAIFSLVNAVLLRPLPFYEPDRLVMVWEDASRIGFPRGYPAPGNYADWKAQNQVFEDMGAFTGRSFNLTGDGDPEQIEAQAVTANFFPLLGVQPMLGRTFLPEEGRPESHPVALVSYGLWQRRFGGDPDLVGRDLRLDGQKFRVVGVMPAGFQAAASPRRVATPEHRAAPGQPSLRDAVGRGAVGTGLKRLA